MARLFKLSDLNPLKCHKDDCVPNVLAYIKLLERDDAYKIANVNDQILIKHIVDFLDHTYDTTHELLEIYNTDEDPSPNMVEEIIEEQFVRDMLDDQLKNNTVTIGVFLGKVNHTALFGKINNELYIIDPQSGEQLSMDDPNIGLYLYKFNKIYLIKTKRHNAKVRSNASQFKKSSHMYTIKQRIRANPNALKWTQYVLQHSRLIPNKKYRIINKKTNKEITSSIFLRFDEKNAVFKDIIIPTQEHFFIEINNSLKPKSLSIKRNKNRNSKYASI